MRMAASCTRTARRIQGSRLAAQLAHGFAGLHVEGHREGSVDHQPLAVALLETNGRAHPVVSLLAVRARGFDMTEVVTERDIAICSDAQVVDLIFDRARHHGEPSLEVLAVVAGGGVWGGGGRGNTGGAGGGGGR